MSTVRDDTSPARRDPAGDPLAGGPFADDAPDAAARARRAIEHCYAQGWTDGLPVVPCDEELLGEFLATTDRPADEVILGMAHLNRACTVRLAAINAAMAGCEPAYFPVVLAALDSLVAEGYVTRAIWQSTTGTAPCLLVNGPVRARIGLNSRGNVFGSGFRANATIGRAIRLVGINAFGIRPHELDQATQGTPAKYTCAIAENEEDSPWPPFHVEHGFAPTDSTVTAFTSRSVLHVEARHTTEPEQLLRDLADSVARTGALIHATTSACLVLSPEHAQLLGRAGWSRTDIREFVHEEAVNSRSDLRRVGKSSVSRETRWRLPDDHPDAVADDAGDLIGALAVPESLQIVVAGAPNAGVSAIIETFGPRGPTPAVTRVEATAG
ncbi:MAG: hypothetical protein S0880_16425 [Actinomycetota bacterium]|nr:hypothetical protein [Actinomycetota bacterium]